MIFNESDRELYQYLLIYNKDNNVVIDVNSINISAIFEVNSNTKGVLFPRMTKAPLSQRLYRMVL